MNTTNFLNENLNDTISSKLEDGLIAFSNLTQIPVTFLSDNQTVLWECLAENKLCKCFSQSSLCSPSCEKTLDSAMRIATQLKEPYIFLCDVGLMKIAYPLILDKTYHGCFFVGPIPMGHNNETVIKHLAEKLPILKESSAKIAFYFSKLKVFTPTEITYIHEIFHDVILSALWPASDYGLIYENFKEEYRLDDPNYVASEMDYPFQLEIDLIEGIKSGNLKMVKTVFKDFFDIICALEAGNLSYIKIRLMGVYGQVSRLISKDVLSGNATFQYLDSLEILNSALTYKKAFEVSLDLFCSISEIVSSKSMDGRSPIIIKAIRYVSEHYSENISLDSAAKSIHANTTYLSSLFKKETGLSFTLYLSQFRIHQSLRLLSETNIDLTSISYMVGFNSQSYFTKVFREIMDSTPTEYRKHSKSK
ncbi:MAG: PocR ligand-binding domain-containing protein [Anaerovoracaceae bacterium]